MFFKTLQIDNHFDLGFMLDLKKKLSDQSLQIPFKNFEIC